MACIARTLALGAAAAAGLGACGSAGASSNSGSGVTPTATRAAADGRSGPASSAPAQRRPSFPAYPVVLPGAATQPGPSWQPAVSIRGRTAVWISRVRASDTGVPITRLRFDQSLVQLALHAGSGSDPGGSGWPYGPSVGRQEIHHLVAGFNGAFHLADGVGGFREGGRVAAPMQSGAASVVTYSDGTTDIGSWGVEVPAAGRPVFSVRQNLHMLIDHGRATPTVASCRICWGPTLGGVDNTARAGIGITSTGELVWAGGETLSVPAIADALLAAGARRALELDINPEWVAGFLYAHHPHGGRIEPIPLVQGQYPLPGSFLAPYNRDFFTVLARA